MTENTTTKAGARTHAAFGANYIGCVIDGSASSADYINKETVEFAEGFGFNVGLFSGCIDGLSGLSIEMTLDDAESASHSGQCDEDVADLVSEDYIAKQLDAIPLDVLRNALSETGAWTAEELSDDEQNRHRAVWIAAGDIRENSSQTLSEMGDEAVNWLNEQDLLSCCSFYFDDNSLFYAASIRSATGGAKSRHSAAVTISRTCRTSILGRAAYRKPKA